MPLASCDICFRSKASFFFLQWTEAREPFGVMFQALKREQSGKLTRHEMQENGGDGVERWTVGDVGAGVAEHAHNSIRHRSAFLREMIWQTMGGIDEGRQHDGLLGKFCRSEYLRKKRVSCWRKHVDQSNRLPGSPCPSRIRRACFFHGDAMRTAPAKVALGLSSSPATHFRVLEALLLASWPAGWEPWCRWKSWAVASWLREKENKEKLVNEVKLTMVNEWNFREIQISEREINEHRHFSVVERNYRRQLALINIFVVICLKRTQTSSSWVASSTLEKPHTSSVSWQAINANLCEFAANYSLIVAD